MYLILLTPIFLLELIDLSKNQKKLSVSETFLFFLKKPPAEEQLTELQEAINRQIDFSKPYIIPILLPGAKKNAFLNNPKLSSISNSQVAQFSINVEEVDVIDSIINAIKGNSHLVYINNKTLPRADLLPSGFKADLGKITDLLIGESVYETHAICIRELLQNSNDACSRMRESIMPGDPQPEIIINIDKKNRYFDIIDTGDGMTKNILANTFSILGRSING